VLLCTGARIIAVRAHHSNGAGGFGDNARRNAAEITAKGGTSASANDDVIDSIVTRVVDKLARRIC